LQDEGDLLLCELRLLHRRAPSSATRIRSQFSHDKWPSLAGSAHSSSMRHAGQRLLTYLWLTSGCPRKDVECPHLPDVHRKRTAYAVAMNTAFLDGLRGLAAALVLFAHCAIWSGSVTLGLASVPAGHVAKLAVDLFMILSGCLMAFTVHERRM